MTTFFKPQVKLEQKTNINNTNYTNNNNNKLTTTNFTLCVTKANEEDISPTGLSGLASLPRPLGSPGVPRRGVLADPEEILYHAWKGLKIDLFDNGIRGSGEPSLKLSFGIIKKDGTTQQLFAHMNSPARYIWRNVPDTELNTPHWCMVRDIQDQFEANNINYRSSKCCLPKKGNGTDIVAFLSENNSNWLVMLVMNASTYHYNIPKDCNITAAQRKGNIIASKFIGQTFKKLLTAEDLGLL